MAVISTFTCVCGRQKQESNHWILARFNFYGVHFMPWNWDLALCNDVIVLCGEGCATALLSRSLGEWKQTSSASATNGPAWEDFLAVLSEQEPDDLRP